MNHEKWKETLSIILSALLALALFLVLLLLFRWNLILCLVLAAATYGAGCLLFRPVAKIGKIEVDSINNGEFLNERLREAAADYARMKKAAARIRETALADECRELIGLAGSILRYLTDNPEKIPTARRYIDYYQETAANVLEHYVELRATGLSTPETAKILQSTQESVTTLKAAFSMQFEKLMQNDLMDMEADLKLLRQTLRSEGYKEPEKKEPEKKGQETPK